MTENMFRPKPIDDEWWTTQMVCAYLKLGRRALWDLRRHPDRGFPDAIKPGGKMCLFRAADVRAWVEARGRAPTSRGDPCANPKAAGHSDASRHDAPKRSKFENQSSDSSKRRRIAPELLGAQRIAATLLGEISQQTPTGSSVAGDRPDLLRRLGPNDPLGIGRLAERIHRRATKKMGRLALRRARKAEAARSCTR